MKGEIGTHRHNRERRVDKAPVLSLPPLAAEVVEATTQLYRTVAYELPWIGYLALEDGICVGSCGFKSPPQNNRVEIAYFTFPGHESRGVATLMASEFIRLATNKIRSVPHFRRICGRYRAN